MSFQNLPITLIIPAGATTGPRIIIDGVNGVISVYDSSNFLVMQIEHDGIYVASDLTNLINANWLKVSVTDGINGNPAFLIQPGLSDGGTETWDAGRITSREIVVGASARQGLALYSPTATFQAFLKQSGIALNCEAIDGSVASSINYMAYRHIFTTVQQSNVNYDFPFTEGVEIDCTDVTGSGGSIHWYSNGRETPHTMTPLLNSWGNATAGTAKPSYRHIASPPNCVELRGQIHSPATFVSGVFFTLPVGYRPATQQYIFATRDTGATFAIQVSSNGTCLVSGLTTGGVDLAFNGIISLDWPSN